MTTRRAVTRVALVATETAARFQREGLSHDPMSWMLAPCALLGGAIPLDARLKRDACLRGILLHALSMGLDADPAVIDALTDDEDGAEAEELDFDGVEFEAPPPARPSDGEPRLFIATVIAMDGLETVHASLAVDGPNIARRSTCA